MKRGHDRTRDWLALWLRERTGSSAPLAQLTEQPVEAWDDAVQGRPRQAVLDVAFSDRLARRAYADVVFAAAGAGDAAERARHARTAGASVADAVRGKLRRYKPGRTPSLGFVPFAVGALGRLSPEAHGLLTAFAVDGQDARRALQQLSALTQQRLADVLRASEPWAA